MRCVQVFERWFATSGLFLQNNKPHEVKCTRDLIGCGAQIKSRVRDEEENARRSRTQQ